MKKILLLLLIAASAEAADQKILIPVLYNGPGQGTRWQSGLAIINKMSQSFRSPGVPFAILCPIPEGCFADAIPAGQFGWLALNTAPGGLLLMAPAEEADKLVLRLEIGAVPRNPINGIGTAIPIVRERDFRIPQLPYPMSRWEAAIALVFAFTIPIPTKARRSRFRSGPGSS
ncbi:MAG TPA: hypothetical protein VER58_01960 [Thermoanaerobaculia bacterium]|nr:hypothetical protein [Thermoanaerobaculia bacterium]